MTSHAAGTTRFRPAFKVIVTPGAIETRTGENGDYTVLPDAHVAKLGRADRKHTLLAFDGVRQTLEGRLKPGQPIELTLRSTARGALKIVGMPTAQAA
ncbi:hypothetical protein [Sphingosinicella sp. BN140058]|uniref:hypothetical protein n=1 Tax=Sphingosinicella sp. BN140058 TaxID=1892855 RepID=UPI001012E7D3|nr:hypothetical protein [Sphingosinicella sp. BN140058]QAY80285.1 hypothetical protein ETR14_26950 [Sphingosinicella sp. BN140058]